MHKFINIAKENNSGKMFFCFECKILLCIIGAKAEFLFTNVNKYFSP